MRAAPWHRLARGVALAVMLALPAVAQDGPALEVPRAPILMVDRERLLVETMFGQAVEARFQASSKQLIDENLRLEQALESEERDLTDRRATLPAEEFQKLAAEFDAKTEAIRAAQDAKSRALTNQRELDRQRFLQAAVPVLGDLMRESGAVAVFDKALVILSLRGVDITDEAIARIDTVLGDGSNLPPLEPAPEGAVTPEAGMAP